MITRLLELDLDSSMHFFGRAWRGRRRYLRIALTLVVNPHLPMTTRACGVPSVVLCLVELTRSQLSRDRQHVTECNYRNPSRSCSYLFPIAANWTVFERCSKYNIMIEWSYAPGKWKWEKVLLVGGHPRWYKGHTSFAYHRYHRTQTHSDRMTRKRREVKVRRGLACRSGQTFVR